MTPIDEILSGSLSRRAQGFMIVPPRGHRLDGAVREALVAAYGGENHPDIRVIRPDGAGDFIKVEAIRDAQGFLASTPSGAEMKSLVILRAERMHPSAANALLKPLEEPTRHTRIVLVTENPAALPPTIRSRCAVHPADGSRDLARRELLDQAGAVEAPIAPGQADALLDLADDDPGLALQIHLGDLANWLDGAARWLSGRDAAPPLPVLAGKEATPLAAASMAFQSLLSRAARGAIALPGWSEERALRASWSVIEKSTDITRAGIDAKTRLTCLMTGARSA